MNKKLFYFLTLCIFYNVKPLMAANGNWQCSAHDNNKLEWSAASNYKRVALNKALEACKQNSNIPATCKASNLYCGAYIDGISTTPMWRCIALDRLANPWKGNLYPDRDDAALAAKAYCKARSSIPDTCYVYVSTCRNLNFLD